MSLLLGPGVFSVPDLSPLVLIDRLISLAEQADLAGMETIAGRLVQLAYSVGEKPPN